MPKFWQPLWSKLVRDGADIFTDDTARFHRAPAPSQAELERLLDTLVQRITRTLVRASVLVEDPEPILA
ncbi:MAG: hypothetical protein ACI9R3_006329 [Verrucomicrobiales bacterium]|jgi:hypothetical protein